MAAYSLDLRKRIVDDIERGVGTRSEVAKLFGVHESFVYKLLRQKRERGDLAPLPHGGGAHAKLTEDQSMILSDLVVKTPDATLSRKLSRRSPSRIFADGLRILAIPSHSTENRCKCSPNLPMVSLRAICV
jgi:transposase-like protein